MNKRLALISLAILVSILTACQQPGFEPKAEEKGITKAGQEAARALLKDIPVEMAIPNILPETIADPLILRAWVVLYNQQEAVKLWDGSAVTGQSLAQFVLDHQIQILWGSQDICHGNSCAAGSVRHDRSKKDAGVKIYVALWIKDAAQGNISTLVETLAHELFHLSSPLQGQKDSQFEEYWAFYVGAHVAHTTWVHFSGYDSLNPACLQRWFTHYDMKSYLELEAYPQPVLASANPIADSCPSAIDTNLPDDAVADGVGSSN